MVAEGLVLHSGDFLERFSMKRANKTSEITTIQSTIESSYRILLIYDKYITPNAPNELNIPGPLQTKIKNIINQGSLRITVFDVAINEVLNMLYQNCFKAFVQNHSINSSADKKSKSFVHQNSDSSLLSNSTGLLDSKILVSDLVSSSNEMLSTPSIHFNIILILIDLLSSNDLKDTSKSNGYTVEYNSSSFAIVMESNTWYEEFKLYSVVTFTSILIITSRIYSVMNSLYSLKTIRSLKFF